jgi:hypothetical protein
MQGTTEVIAPGFLPVDIACQVMRDAVLQHAQLQGLKSALLALRQQNYQRCGHCYRQH